MEFIKKNLGLIIIVAVIIAVIAYAMRKKGTESNFEVTGCEPGQMPDPTTGECGDSWSWDQEPTEEYQAVVMVPEEM